MDKSKSKGLLGIDIDKKVEEIPSQLGSILSNISEDTLIIWQRKVKLTDDKYFNIRVKSTEVELDEHRSLCLFMVETAQVKVTTGKPDIDIPIPKHLLPDQETHEADDVSYFIGLDLEKVMAFASKMRDTAEYEMAKLKGSDTATSSSELDDSSQSASSN